MSPAGRKPLPPPPSPAVKPAAARLHPLGSYSAHATLRDLVVAHFGEPWAAGYDIDALTVSARDALNTTLAAHGLRIGEDDTFFTTAEQDDDSDLVIGRALEVLDVAALAAAHRLSTPH